jgi:hypothetical protein
MTTRLRRQVSRVARVGIRRWGERANRIRPTPTTVVGQTVMDLTIDVVPVRVVISAKSGKLVEQGWGQHATGEYMALVEPDQQYSEGDLIDPQEGVHVGELFRVTFTDPQASAVALELVHAGNA